MRWKLPRPRFGLRTLLLGVLACAVGVWLWTNAPERWRTYRNLEARKRIDPYELSIAGDGNPRNIPPELVAILGDSRMKHWNRIEDVELLPGERLASRGLDGVRIWDLAQVRQDRYFDAVRMAVSRDGQRLFVADRESVVRAYDTTTWKVVAEIGVPGNYGAIDLASSADGARLTTETGQDRAIRQLRVWDLASGALVWTRDTPGTYPRGIALSGDGKLVAWCEDKTLKVVEADTDRVLVEIPPREQILAPEEGYSAFGFDSIAFTADDANVVARSGYAGTEIITFDVRTGDATPWIQQQRQGSIGGFATSADGKRMAMRLSNRFYVYGESSEPGEVWRERIEIACLQGYVSDLAIGNRLLAAAHEDRSITLWDTHKPGRPWRLPGGGLGIDVSSLAFDPTGRRLVTGSRDGQMVVWSTTNWHPLRRWKGHVEQIGFLFWSKDGRHIVSSSDDSKIAVWDAANAAEVVSFGNTQFAMPLSLTDDGKRLATACGNVNEPGLWNIPGGNPVALDQSKVSGRWRGLLSISPRGDLVIMSEGAVSVRDARTLRPIGTLAGEVGRGVFDRIAWSPDGKLAAIHNWHDQSVRIWQPATCTLLHTFQPGSGFIQHAAFDPTGRYIALSGGNTPIQIWHLPTGKLVKSWQIGPVSGVVAQVHFSPDGHYLATVNGNGTVYILSLDGVLKP